MELVHPLDPRAVLEARDLVELVLQFLPSDLLEPLLAHDPIVLLLLLSMIDDLLAPLGPDAGSILDALLDLLLGLDAAFDVLDDLKLLFLDGLLLSYLDLCGNNAVATRP